MPPKARSAPDEPEQPLGLARIVDVVGQGPELADEQDADDQPEQVESHRDPCLICLEQHPERDEQRHHPASGARDDPAPRHQARQPAVKLHHDPDEESRCEQHIGQVVGPQLRDELRPRHRLDDVVGRHCQKGVREHQERGDALIFLELDEQPNDALRTGRAH